MTHDDLNRLREIGQREIGQRATAGPWRRRNEGSAVHDANGTVVFQSDIKVLQNMLGPNDANFIVAARNNWDALLDEIEQLRAALTTPEVCAGVVSEALESERDALAREIARLRAALDATDTIWTDEECFRLNADQHRQDRHPYTCGNDSRHRPLIATRYGWRCADCDYRQTPGISDARPETGTE